MVCEAIRSNSTFFRVANSSATYFTKDGSFVLPRKGTGARYGESVSIRIELRGTLAATSLTCIAFLNVTIPE